MGGLTHLVQRNGASQTKQPQLDSSSLDHPRACLVDDSQVLHLVLARPEFLKDVDILNQSPDSEHRDRKGDSSCEKVRELRKWKVNESIVESSGQRLARSIGRDREQLRASRRWNER